MEINPFKIDVFDLYKREKRAFDDGKYHILKTDYSDYAEKIEELCKIIRSHLTKKKLFKKRRIDDIENFKLLQENYTIEKEDNIELQRFPEPDYFTTRTEYYEYLAEEYQFFDFSPLIFAFKIRHTPLDEIYDLIASAEKNMIGDIEEFMYHLEYDFKVLIPYDAHIVIFNWSRKVPKNHPSIFKIINGENTPISSIYAFYEEEQEQRRKQNEGKGFNIFGDSSLLPPPVTGEDEFKNNEEEEPKYEYELTHDPLSVDFDIEICSIFNTERDQAREKDYQYTAEQLVFLNKMIDEVKSYLIFNRKVVQYKDKDKYHFWNHERRYKEETTKNKAKNYFPEPHFFVQGQAIYYYLAGYHSIIAYQPNQEGIYELFFAFRLRQMQLKDVLPFLKEKQKEFSGDFIEFLDLVLLKYKCLFSENLLAVIHQKKMELEQGGKNDDKPEKVGNLSDIPSNTVTDEEEMTSKKTLPDGYTAIPGKLPLNKIKAYLSYFYKEDNGSTDKKTLISEEEFDAIFKYGFAYPTVEPKIKLAEFSRGNKRIKSIFYFFFFHLYQKNAPEKKNLNDGYKAHYAKFLKHHIKGFSATIASIEDGIKDELPDALRKNKKVFEKYLKMLD